MISGLSRADAISEVDGTFQIPADHKWGVFIIPMTPAPRRANVTIHANGYKDVQQEIFSTVIGPATTNFGQITLERFP